MIRRSTKYYIELHLSKNIWMLSKNIIKLCAACRPSVVVLAAVSSGRPSCCYFLPALAAATGWSPPGHRLSSDYPGPDPDTGPCHLSSTQYLSGKAAEKIILSVWVIPQSQLRSSCVNISKSGMVQLILAAGKTQNWP